MKTDLAAAASSKPHFQLLDGLRGLAAIAVVLFHFMEIATPDYRDNFIPRSYLAVDFFFCLSGFVMAYAYDRKMKTMGILSFFKRRLIRLQPLVLIGSIIGLLAFIFDPFSDLMTAFTPLQHFLMFMSSAFLIPYPIVPQRYFNLFHLNPPTWSLFWEYIGNIFYALFLCRLPLKALQVLWVIAAVLLSYESYVSGYLAVGFGGDNFWGGGIRLFYSFTAGILLFRSRWRPTRTLGFYSILLLFTVTFFIPYSKEYGAFIDPIIVIGYFPLLISLSVTKDHITPIQFRLCKWLGDISYPLYIIHYPFVWIFMSYVERHKPSSQEMAFTISMAMLILITFAYGVWLVLDLPLRKLLNKKVFDSEINKE